MADAVIAYIREQKLDKPVLVGHSLGGLLAMKIALKAPELPGRLVLVDSLPFFAAIMGPGIDDAEAAKPVADAYRKDARHDDARAVRRRPAGICRQHGDLPRKKPRRSRRRAARSDPATTGQAMGELLLTDLRPDLGKIKMPRRSYWARWRPAVARGNAARGRRGNLSPAVREAGGGRGFVFFEKARHFIMVDDLDGFTDALRNDLGGRNTEGGGRAAVDPFVFRGTCAYGNLRTNSLVRAGEKFVSFTRFHPVPS